MVQMMKAMQGRGCADSSLTRQVEQLLSDAALQEYTAAFTPGREGREYGSDFTPGFLSKYQYRTNGFTPDRTSSAIPPPVNQQDLTGRTSGVKCRELKGEKHTFLIPAESEASNKGISSASLPASPAHQHASVQATASPVVSAGGEDEDEKLRFHEPDIKVKSSLDQTRPSPPPPSSSPRVSPSRRLSSPEKIINLHEQLHKTIMSSYQVRYCKSNVSCTQVSVGGV